MRPDTQGRRDARGGTLDAGMLSGAVPLAPGVVRVIRGEGRSEEQALEQAAVALCAVVADPAAVEVREEVEVECGPKDLDLLLADWLGALVHNMAARRLRFRCFAVRLDGRRLFGHAFGEHVDPARHHGALSLRHLSISRPSVHRSADGRWVAECEVRG